jgi:hypothetical protein
MYDGRFRIEVGNTDNIMMKIAFAEEILKRYAPPRTGSINVENSEAFVIVKN